MDGSFSIPAGGLEAGETIGAVAIREAYEEVGVRIAQDDLRYVHTLHSQTEGQAWEYGWD
jgi:8-oxo-dGTP pyrophosphatase MutT (NUDIX family)